MSYFKNSGEIEDNGEIIKNPEYCFRALVRRIPRSTVITFVAAIVFAFLVHGFMFANKLPNHDDINHLFGSNYGAASGRWLLPILLGLDGNLSAPWTIGVISSVLLACASCLTASILRLRSGLTCVLLAAIMVSFPTVGSTFTYMFSADAYFLSLVLACLAAWLTVKYRFGFIGGVLACALSLGIYQSYFGVTAALLLVALIIDVLDGESPRKTLLRALKFVAAAALGLALYFVIVKLTTRTDGLVDYMGIADMGKLEASDLPRLITNAYRSYYQFYIVNARVSKFVFVLYLPAMLALIYSVLGQKKRSPYRIFMTLLLFILLPLAGALVYVMVPDAEIHTLMVYGLSIFLIFPLALYEMRPDSPRGLGLLRNAACWVIVISLAIASYNYGVHTNEAYMKMSLSYEQAASYSTRLLSAVETYEGYDVNTPLVLVGKAMTNVEFKPTPELDEIIMTGAITAESIINSYSYGYFLRYYMGASNIIFATETPISKTLAQNPVVREMQTYPAAGSIAMVDGYIVVRLS